MRKYKNQSRSYKWNVLISVYITLERYFDAFRVKVDEKVLRLLKIFRVRQIASWYYKWSNLHWGTQTHKERISIRNPLIFQQYLIKLKSEEAKQVIVETLKEY
jgi:hypothetical protein